MEKSAEFIVNSVMKQNFGLTVDALLQPIFDTASFTCVGTELLMRGVHRKAYVSPGLFINKLEENGGIVLLGSYIIRLAFEYMATAIMPLNSSYALHINFSPVQLNVPGFAEHVISLSERLKVPASRMVFEITDNNIKLDDSGLENVQRLRQAGFLLAWDDIHSLALLEQKLALLKCDFIKLDRSCFRAASSDETMDIIRYAKEQAVEVIAEGVETFSQMQMLFNHDVKMAQGYLFSRPMDRDTFRSRYLLVDKE